VAREGAYVRAHDLPVLASGEDPELATSGGEKAVDGEM
jgi:hypothetical protein